MASSMKTKASNFLNRLNYGFKNNVEQVMYNITSHTDKLKPDENEQAKQLHDAGLTFAAVANNKVYPRAGVKSNRKLMEEGINHYVDTGWIHKRNHDVVVSNLVTNIGRTHTSNAHIGAAVLRNEHLKTKAEQDIERLKDLNISNTSYNGVIIQKNIKDKLKKGKNLGFRQMARLFITSFIPPVGGLHYTVFAKRRINKFTQTIKNSLISEDHSGAGGGTNIGIKSILQDSIGQEKYNLMIGQLDNVMKNSKRNTLDSLLSFVPIVSTLILLHNTNKWNSKLKKAVKTVEENLNFAQTELERKKSTYEASNFGLKYTLEQNLNSEKTNMFALNQLAPRLKSNNRLEDAIRISVQKELELAQRARMYDGIGKLFPKLATDCFGNKKPVNDTEESKTIRSVF